LKLVYAKIEGIAELKLVVIRS